MSPDPIVKLCADVVNAAVSGPDYSTQVRALVAYLAEIRAGVPAIPLVCPNCGD